jgi:homoserine O-acetyltransferase
MNEKFFESSDSVRHAHALKYAETVTLDGPLALERGGELPTVQVTYETYGKLSKARDNAVLICHALSGDSHVAAHDESDDPGWWDIVVGPGKPIDTDKYFVICPNVLGGCRGTTGPRSINPATGAPYGREFPTVTIADMVEVQRRVVEMLGIEKLLAVTGGSMGGHQVLQWALYLPEKVRGAIPIATSTRLTSQALAFDVVGRNAILNDPNYREGQYYNGDATPNVGLAIARMLGHITYLSREAMKDKFEEDRHEPRMTVTGFEQQFSVGSYLAYKGDKFVEIFDPNSYVAISMAMDLFDLGPRGEHLVELLGKTRCRWLVISFTSDWLFPADQSREIVDALLAANRPVTYCNVTSSCGHDAFLLPNDLDRYGGLISAFLANLDNGNQPVGDSGEAEKRRLEYELLVEVSEPGESVLDLGCGNGDLLAQLRARGHGPVMGIDIDEKAVLACAQRGLDVIHADLNAGLSSLADGQFDIVVLSRTLQVIEDVEGVLDDMLRVGRRCIVSFPNFAYRKLRKMFSERGRAPESAGVLRYKWYNTPNIRFLSIADFEDYCSERGLLVHRRFTLDTEAGLEINNEPNLNADLAIFVISQE